MANGTISFARVVCKFCLLTQPNQARDKSGGAHGFGHAEQGDRCGTGGQRGDGRGLCSEPLCKAEGERQNSGRNGRPAAEASSILPDGRHVVLERYRQQLSTRILDPNRRTVGVGTRRRCRRLKPYLWLQNDTFPLNWINRPSRIWDGTSHREPYCVTTPTTGDRLSALYRSTLT